MIYLLKLDTEYKYLKVLLDGQLEKRPENVLIYATSNRRYLIMETWSDRGSVGEDIFRNDTVNEKLSLTERFGIHILFMTPSQTEYLNIVEGLLLKEVIELNEDIKGAALQWELSYNGRSGRTAHQLVKIIKEYKKKRRLSHRCDSTFFSFYI